MAKVPSDMKQFTTQVPIELYHQFEALAKSLGRPFAREVAEAFRRHLDNPPRLEQRPHPDCSADDAAPARPRGRPATAHSAQSTPGPARSPTIPQESAPAKVPRKARAQSQAEQRTEARRELASLDEESDIKRVSLADEGGCMGLDP